MHVYCHDENWRKHQICALIIYESLQFGDNPREFVILNDVPELIDFDMKHFASFSRSGSCATATETPTAWRSLRRRPPSGSWSSSPSACTWLFLSFLDSVGYSTVPYAYLERFRAGRSWRLRRRRSPSSTRYFDSRHFPYLSWQLNERQSLKCMNR